MSAVARPTLQNRRVSLLVSTWIAVAKARRKVFGRVAQGPSRAELVARFAPDASFADIGCMWSVDGAIAFLAEEHGATAVTGIDLMPASEAFEAERSRRSSAVRFLQGDLNDADLMAQVGGHEVVWCSGVLYHAPNPWLTLERLCSITLRTLILSTETIPEVPGLRQACVFYPALPDGDRRAHAWARRGRIAAGLSTPFDPAQGYGTWWWGLTRSAVRAMLTAAGLSISEEHGDGFHAVFVAHRGQLG